MNALSRWLDRLDDRLAARAWKRRHDKSLRKWLASERFAQIKACGAEGHPNRRPNPAATAVIDRGDRAEVCLGCGIGIVTPRRKS